MAIDFEKFDKSVDLEGLKADIADAQNNEMTFDEVPHDVYDVKIRKMEIGETGPKSKNPGSPMFVCWFEILDGEHKGQLIFMNQVITQGFQIHIVKEFLRSLGTSFEVKFESYSQFNDLILDMAEEIDGSLEYQLNYDQNAKGFNIFEIEDIFEV